MELCQVFRPESRADLGIILSSGIQPHYIPRGLGRSYGDAALNGGAGVISLARLNRLLAFDTESGLLECEAGVSLDEILDSFLPRGFFLPVTPGTRFITVGGAIANDIHGKNHHRDGTIANFLAGFKLLTPQGEVVACSPETNSELFWATVGGIGLTGVIISAQIRLRPVESAYVVVDYHRARNLDEALCLFEESDDAYEYSVAWIDCLATNDSMGRAVLMRGNHARAGDLPSRVRNPLARPRKAKANIPLELPSFILNRATARIFNASFYGRHRKIGQRLKDVNSYFYPLDVIQNWNRIYGRRGVVQYQLVLPMESSRSGLMAVLERLGRSRRSAFLGVLKRFGPGNAGLLSFPFEGYTLAVDLPASKGLVPFLHELDEILLQHGGRVYLAKDAVVRPETFAAMYPMLPRFRELKQRLDPQSLLSSSMARRLGILAE